MQGTIHMPYGSQSAEFWWSQSLLCKRQTDAKNLHPFQWVAADVGVCSSGVFSPLPFCFCCWLTAFSLPWYSFSLESLSCHVFLYICDALSTSTSFRVDENLTCVLSAHQLTPVTSILPQHMKHRGAKRVKAMVLYREVTSWENDQFHFCYLRRRLLILGGKVSFFPARLGPHKLFSSLEVWLHCITSV